MALGIGVEAKAGLGDGAALADAGDDVLQRAPLGHVVEHVVGGDQRQIVPRGKRGETLQPLGVVAAIEMLRGEIGAAGEIRRQAGEKGGKGGVERVRRSRRRKGDDELSFAMRRDIGVIELALALPGAPLADGEETREATIGGAIGGKTKQAGAVAEIEAAGGDEADADHLGRLVGAHDAGKRIAVGDGEGPMAERGGGHRQLLGMRGAAQEGEIAGDLQLGVAGAHRVTGKEKRLNHEGHQGH